MSDHERECEHEMIFTPRCWNLASGGGLLTGVQTASSGAAPTAWQGFENLLQRSLDYQHRVLYPPDGEPAEGGGGRDISREWTLCEDTGRLAEQGVCPEHGGDSCLRQYAPVSDDPAQRQDATLERREALEEAAMTALQHLHWAACRKAPCMDEDTAKVLSSQVRRALSHTSDEGTGCVVPESIRRLSEQWQEEYDDLLAGDDGMQEYLRGKRDAGHELDRAIAEQGGQQSDASRTSNIIAFDHAADILDPDTPEAVRGAHSDHWKRVAARNLRDISDQMRKAAAPKPEQQDAMLERRDVVEALDEIEEAIVSTANILQDFIGEKTTGILGSQTVDPLMVAHGQLGDLRRALSRTSDGVPDWVIQTLRMIRDIPRPEHGDALPQSIASEALDRALAEQGEQRVPKEAVGYAAIGDDGNVKGLWVLRDWDHAEAFADSCGCSLAPVFFGPQGNALAAAPQPEHGGSDD